MQLESLCLKPEYSVELAPNIFFPCESVQHEIVFPPGRSPLGMMAGSRCLSPRCPSPHAALCSSQPACRSAGMAIREPQRGQGSAVPNEGVQLPHPILHGARAMEGENSSSSLSSPRLSSAPYLAFPLLQKLGLFCGKLLFLPFHPHLEGGEK